MKKNSMKYIDLKYKRNFFKTISLWLVLVLLGSSCHSYRSIDMLTEDIKLDRKYKITTKDYHRKKIKIKEIKEGKIAGVTARGEKIKISIDGVEEIKRRRFSYVKTLSIPVVYSGFLLLAISTANYPSLGLGGLRFPN